MPKYNVLPQDMTLYSPAEPEGRMFPKGSMWPGDAWSDKPGGEVAGAGTTKQAIADLQAAQDQIVKLQDMLQRHEHDRAQLAKERDEAVAALKDAEARAQAAEKAQKDAEDTAKEVTGERDRALSVESGLRAKITELEAEIAKVDGDGDGKVGGSAPTEDAPKRRGRPPKSASAE